MENAKPLHRKPLSQPNSTASEEGIQQARAASGVFAQRDVLNLQRQIGNRATTSILAPSRKIQRDIDLEGVINAQLLMDSLIEYQDVESESTNDIDTRRWKSYEPLFQMFGSANNTTLKFTTGSYKRVNFATTEFFAVTEDGSLNYDEQRDAFADAVINQQVERFVVRVMFNGGLVREEALEPGLLNRKGVVLQALVHELTVHAENMLRFTEQYWRYVGGGEPPDPLGTASEEHVVFKARENKRYELLSKIVKQRGGQVGDEFSKRESDDLRTAK